MKDEDDEDQHEGNQVGENPHQVVLVWTLRDKQSQRLHNLQKTPDQIWLSAVFNFFQIKLRGFVARINPSPRLQRYHEEEGRPQGAQQLGGVGGDRVDPGAPGQREEPRLAHHVQVRGDVHRGVLTARVGGGREVMTCCRNQRLQVRRRVWSSPGEPRRHGAVVQVEGDDAAALELLQREPTAWSLLQLWIQVLDQRAQIWGQPQHLGGVSYTAAVLFTPGHVEYLATVSWTKGFSLSKSVY